MAQGMDEQFTLRDVYLCAEGLELDLHNDYDFCALHYSVENRSVSLYWRKGDGEWVPGDGPREIELTYEGVERFEFHPRDAELPFTEDDCLFTVGYWTDEDCANGIYVASDPPDSKWLRAFEFQSRALVLILAKQAHVILNR